MSEHALVDRICAAFATLAFAVQMLVVAEMGHAMPGVPILALLALPFALYAVVGDDGRLAASEPELAAVEPEETYLVASR